MDDQTASQLPTTSQHHWDAKLYDGKHSFVSELGADLLNLLSPKSGEFILDLGCGTGYLTDTIAQCGAEVVGIDSAPTMIEQARSQYPHLKFEVADAINLQLTEQFDAVFSNAVLHWIKEPAKVIAGVYRALKPGGRFVAEFGGKGNVKAIVAAVDKVMQAADYPLEQARNRWYFPSIGEYGTLLEQQGLQLTFAALFERPTPLADGEKGMQNWLKMFANSLFQDMPAAEQLKIFADIEKQLRPYLYQNGTWFVDYQRIRVIALKL